MGCQPRHARDDEQRVGDFRRQADVAADGRDRAIDVHRQPAILELRVLAERHLQRADELRVLVIDLELVGDLEQPDRPRIDRVIPVAEPGRRNLVGLDQPRRERRRGVDDGPPRSHDGEPIVEQLAAGERVAAVMASESQNPRGDRAAERRAGGGRISRRPKTGNGPANRAQ